MLVCRPVQEPPVTESNRFYTLFFVDAPDPKTNNATFVYSSIIGGPTTTVSISKVAKLAGVSNSTVSRVINNHPRVAAETVQSVRMAMKELGYVPSVRRPGPKPLARAQRPASSIAFLVMGTSP